MALSSLDLVQPLLISVGSSPAASHVSPCLACTPIRKSTPVHTAWRWQLWLSKTPPMHMLLVKQGLLLLGLG